MPGRLFYFVGLPRSGKSTVSRTFEQDPNCLQQFNSSIDRIDRMQPRIVYNSDSMRLSLYGRAFSNKAEGMLSAMKDVIIRCYLDEMNYNVLVDGTHTTEASLERIFKLSPTATPVIIPTGMEECTARAHATNQSYLEQPIWRMHNNLCELLSWHGDYGINQNHPLVDVSILYRAIENFRAHILEDDQILKEQYALYKGRTS